jgi:phosphoribosylamine--glycine ligase
VSAKRVLVIGNDARTDAIAAACRASSPETELYALTELPIPGLLQKCRRVLTTESLADTRAVVDAAREVRPDLAIVGPEGPLAAGCVDALQRLGISAFGPTGALAKVESSKSWTRALLDRNKIAGNPEYRLFTSSDGLSSYMERLGSFVIKPDGLTAGKGVRVLGEHVQTLEQALGYAESLLAQDGCVQIEDRLDGEEFSVQTITDGESVIHCPPVQDHKRAFEGDQGPNTGGMGSYSCADLSLPFLGADDLETAHSINEQVIEALAREGGEPYRGVLYGGFMAVRDGVRLIEYNARFGDPEAMNVLPLLEADFVELCWAASAGRLGHVAWSFRPKATVCKYIVPRGYPGSAPEDEKIVVPSEDRDREDLRWYWAACTERDGEAYLTSSRSGAFVGIGESLAEAEQKAERAARSIEGAVRHRADIGQQSVIESRIRHVEALRGAAVAVGARAH